MYVVFKVSKPPANWSYRIWFKLLISTISSLLNEDHIWLTIWVFPLYKTKIINKESTEKLNKFILLCFIFFLNKKLEMETI